jgi:hypothetical protein
MKKESKVVASLDFGDITSAGFVDEAEVVIIFVSFTPHFTHISLNGVVGPPQLKQ